MGNKRTNRNAILRVNLTLADKQRIEAAAAAAHLSTSTYLLVSALDNANRIERAARVSKLLEEEK